MARAVAPINHHGLFIRQRLSAKQAFRFLQNTLTKDGVNQLVREFIQVGSVYAALEREWVNFFELGHQGRGGTRSAM
jgi:hypothetical protein